LITTDIIYYYLLKSKNVSLLTSSEGNSQIHTAAEDLGLRTTPLRTKCTDMICIMKSALFIIISESDAR